MLQLRKPFEGETLSDTLAAILKTEPTPVQPLVPQLPAEPVRIINKLLRKDREERYQVVKDLWLDLKALKQELEFQAKLDRSVPSENGDSLTGVMDRAHATTTEAPLNPTETRSAINTITQSISVELKRHKIGVAVVLAIVLSVLGVGAFGIYKVANRKPEVGAFQNIHLARLTNSGDVIDVTISPDGQFIVYVRSDRNNQSLWIRQVSTANDKEIVPPSAVGFFGITFSPDGNDLYYAVKANLDAGTLYRIPTLGGLPVELLET